MFNNLFTERPGELPDEVSELLLDHKNVRIERIVSMGHATREGSWYDQPEHEWVAVLAGEAKLRIEGKEDLIHLEAGDWINLPARCRHRVESTSPEEQTIWLAVFYGDAS